MFGLVFHCSVIIQWIKLNDKDKQMNEWIGHSRDYGLSYLSLRACIGLWTALLCLILVATDASSLVCYITRFTEEAFAALICLIFIYEALEKLFHLGEVYPFNTHSDLDKLTLSLLVTPFLSFFLTLKLHTLHVADGIILKMIWLQSGKEAIAERKNMRMGRELDWANYKEGSP